jgi:hypothetical protein
LTLLEGTLRVELDVGLIAYFGDGDGDIGRECVGKGVEESGEEKRGEDLHIVTMCSEVREKRCEKVE